MNDTRYHDLVVQALPLLTRRWVCYVVRSGYHNGAHCNAREPHDQSWGCGYRSELRVSLTDEQVEQLQSR